ncbi:MAG: hypothetical protein ABS62_00845 [Microbacterium sp. SCN 70-200]|uniref:DUF2252 domain-containing protein n=1 Tax=unclassified Microbacterium TaxID=2609290 RepID=UPI00086B859D|nr:MULTISPECIES: DUF2252 domain-containing protein [unclassified Microbacterium]MBN9214932.1 DUF2252 domain-containing protein [Microbacterium sp.]ODT42968.1 MAG: hypothetical protein ABS62_00845 [Microbacterium sp. SCN 70-200]OJV84726.1 MAG: hypothetical protein BGO46_04905 [Microbacterium sp. 70-16]
MTADPWRTPSSRADQAAAGRAARRTTARRELSRLETAGRDPLGILDAQNATRVPELVPLRRERMSASPFAFYRGTAALMAADLARTADTGIHVASCGDAHVANFGLYASPQRTLVFDLNDFDEAAWAPWEWDLKRLVTSVVIAGQETGRDEAVVRDAVLEAVRTYARSVASYVQRSPVSRYFEHFDAAGSLAMRDKAGRRVVREAIRQAERRTGERAARKLTERGDDGRLRFVEQPPAMAHLDAATAARVERAVSDYRQTAQVDIRLLLEHYVVSDTVLRAVGVGSVGTRCYVTVLQDGDGHALLLQTKQAGRSVLVEHGGCRQPPGVTALVAPRGEGARVVALQRILQGVSDPFLGSFRGETGDYYVRQFRDMKGGFDVESLEDGPFGLYAQACATTLARAHSQSPNAAAITGYIGRGAAVAEALLEWAYAYATLSRADYDAFIAAPSGGA